MKLHLGCGGNIIPGWLNLDIDPAPGGIKCDLTAPLPYRDSSVDLIFNEHFLEHITRHEAIAFMRECRRVLKNGAIMRISTPDLAVAVENYTNMKLLKLPGIWEPKTLAQMVNDSFRLWGHQFLYDLPEIVHLTHDAGFDAHANFAVPGYHKSRHEGLRGIEHRPFMGELIVEVTK